MTGTGELGTAKDGEKLAMLLERVTSLQADTHQQNTTLDGIRATVGEIKLDNVSGRERLTALDARVERNRTVSDNQNIELVTLIREEREAREKAMSERRNAHEADISKINDRLGAIEAKLNVVIAVGGFLAAVAVVYFGGHLLKLFP